MARNGNNRNSGNNAGNVVNYVQEGQGPDVRHEVMDDISEGTESFGKKEAVVPARNNQMIRCNPSFERIQNQDKNANMKKYNLKKTTRA